VQYPFKQIDLKILQTLADLWRTFGKKNKKKKRVSMYFKVAEPL
jgi:hypothetical protein